MAGPFEKPEIFEKEKPAVNPNTQNMSAANAERINSISNYNGFKSEYTNTQCFRNEVNLIYSKHQKEKNTKKDSDGNIIDKKNQKPSPPIDLESVISAASKYGFKKAFPQCETALANCIRKEEANVNTTKPGVSSGGSPEETDVVQNPLSPFDIRLSRLMTAGVGKQDKGLIKTGFSYKATTAATSGFFVNSEYLTEENIDNLDKIKELTHNQRVSMQNNDQFQGVPSLINTYATTTLYGSEGGKYLINTRGNRRWYEVDKTFGDDLKSFSMNPTTSSLISWGTGDPYGRTPYHFTDFVFSKYWKKIENNRLITLRRYPGPILDNLRFPGMAGDETTSKVLLPPTAQAITYFGEETGNNLNNLLKFSTGVKWEEAKGEVWTVGSSTTPDSENGPAGLYKHLSKISNMVNIASGNSDPLKVMNKGALPPDPYKDGPYENRIMGPVNRIDAVQKRAPGIDFKWDGLSIVFEYSARPIGGINTKAVLLDILSNFLIIGSASAVFFGGQHRFMADPGKYPFIGDDNGMKEWYKGNPVKWASTTIQSFTEKGRSTIKGEKDNANQQGFFDQLLGKGEGGFSLKGFFGSLGSTLSNSPLAKNAIEGYAAEKSSGTVPFLTGLKSLLTGEPVGEWHLTIGNPLNPIAMIGNLICKGIDVEFNEELGPDDFPTELKVTVKLEHGMARDKDGIESVFNRGMGRIYTLEDGYEFSADSATKVDKYTQNTATSSGTPVKSFGIIAGASTTGSNVGPAATYTPSNTGEASIWNRGAFLAVSPNTNLLNAEGELARSQYKAVDWVAIKSLKA